MNLDGILSKEWDELTLEEKEFYRKTVREEPKEKLTKKPAIDEIPLSAKYWPLEAADEKQKAKAAAFLKELHNEAIIKEFGPLVTEYDPVFGELYKNEKRLERKINKRRW